MKATQPFERISIDLKSPSDYSIHNMNHISASQQLVPHFEHRTQNVALTILFCK